MIETIKQFHQENGRVPNKSELHRLTGMSRMTIQNRINDLIRNKQAEPKEPTVTYTADYELL